MSLKGPNARPHLHLVRTAHAVDRYRFLGPMQICANQYSLAGSTFHMANDPLRRSEGEFLAVRDAGEARALSLRRSQMLALL